MKMRNVFTGLLLSSMLLLAPCQAGLINWDVAPSNVDYLSPTQVNSSDSGTDFVDSFTFRNASPALAVNGVTFNRYTSSAGNTASFNNSGITVFMGTNNTAVFPAARSPMANSTVNSYGAILSQAGLVLAPADAYIRYTGLTIGANYQIQFWVSPWDNGYLTQFSSSANFSSGVSASVNAVGGVYEQKFMPQYINGSFTADATQQLVYFRNPEASWTTLSSGQIRVVPEPGTMGLLLFGGVAFWFRKKLRTGRPMAFPYARSQAFSTR